jgi:hypothetical protein
MIDLQSEQTLRLTDARKLKWLKGRDGERLSLDSLRRWSLRGLKGVVLETAKIGNTTYTSVEAILRFLARLNDQKIPPIASVRRRQESAADKKLDDAGIL